MKIAIIGWGSLIWDSRQLPLEDNWNLNGPKLPIEFSRISKDGRLTLVIDKTFGEPVVTRYALSPRKDIGDTIDDLRDREGTIKKRIGFLNNLSGTSSKDEYSDQIDIFSEIQLWCENNKYDAAVWTALLSQFKEETGLSFSVDNAINYINNLPQTAKKNALNYIQKAPQEVNTPLRRKLNKINLTA